MICLYCGNSSSPGFFANIARALPGHNRVLHHRVDQLDVSDYLGGVAVARETVDPFLLPFFLAGELLATWYGWGEDLAVIIGMARTRGMRIAYMENAWGIESRVQVDDEGVNAYHSVARLPAETFLRYHSTNTAQITWHQRQIAQDDRRAPLPADDRPLPDGGAFLPLQIEDDAQIVEHAPSWCAHMADVIAAVLAALPDGMPLVVKEHPNADNNDALRAQFPAVTWLRTTPVYDILRACRLVVTINSSVGLEALWHGLPVVTLGRAIYRNAGAFVAETPEMIGEAIDCACASNTNELRAHFLAYLYERVLVRNNGPAIAARLLDIAAGRRPWLEVLDAAG